MDEIKRVKGGAFGFAFAARMFGDNPELSEDMTRVYRWAEKCFIKLATGEITDEEAILGYGG